MLSAAPLLRDLVFIGGGHAHALILRRWGMDPLPGVRLTVIDTVPVTAYSGMLPGQVAGHYPRAAMEIDLVKLARFAGARLLLGGATGIDPDAQTVQVAGHGDVAYDIASLDIGITARMPDLPGFAAHGLPAKPLAQFSRGWEAYIADLSAGRVAPDVAMIGGGVAGVELALTMAERMRACCGTARVTVIERGSALPGLSPKAQAILRARMARSGVTLLEQTALREVTDAGPRLSDGRCLPAALTVGAAGATPHPWLEGAGLELHQGYLAVDAHLRSLSHPTLFGAGDCVHLTHAPRPKAGVFAVRAAPVLGDNLRAALADRPTRPFRPQKTYLKLISLGPKEALAQKGPLVLAGPKLWRLKDRIDRRFMEKLQHLPAMAPPPLPPDAPRDPGPGPDPLCGGCGAKIAPAPLAAALAALPAQAAPGLESRPGDDAAVLRGADGWQVISTDHLRALSDDPATMARIALFHAMGDIWAMGAKPQLALSQLTLPRMSPALQARTMAEVTRATAAAAAEIGAALAGGHSTMGAEMQIGFTVTGQSDRPPIPKGGARPGDALILTRALGSGTLFAAEMRGQANGAWIAELLALLACPQSDAAALLASQAHGMTDITGFGLAGHALEMAEAAGARLCLRTADLPLLPGAAELAAQGIASSIAPDNRAACAGRIEGAAGPLLFDPQTCGGLLAAVPGEAAEGLCAAIREVGAEAWIVGAVEAGAPGLRLE